jgi:hypothetical protein
MLLRVVGGWQEETEGTVARLIEGETIVHRDKAYRVSQEP